MLQVLVSAPAVNKSGTGSSTTTPVPLTSAGEFNSIPAGAPAEGHDSADSKPALAYSFAPLLMGHQPTSGT
jgi:broad specificity polyphosphatase/5'/3'-nucleotidase SurE